MLPIVSALESIEIINTVKGNKSAHSFRKIWSLNNMLLDFYIGQSFATVRWPRLTKILLVKAFDPVITNTFHQQRVVVN